MSSSTFMHTGYTGTCVCVDPVTGRWGVVLTNREEGEVGVDSCVLCVWCWGCFIVRLIYTFATVAVRAPVADNTIERIIARASCAPQAAVMV